MATDLGLLADLHKPLEQVRDKVDPKKEYLWLPFYHDDPRWFLLRRGRGSTPRGVEIRLEEEGGFYILRVIPQAFLKGKWVTGQEPDPVRVYLTRGHRRPAAVEDLVDLQPALQQAIDAAEALIRVRK